VNYLICSYYSISDLLILSTKASHEGQSKKELISCTRRAGEATVPVRSSHSVRDRATGTFPRERRGRERRAEYPSNTSGHLAQLW
jgi:hypothetical protein